MPAAGLPVASITTSTPSRRDSVEPVVDEARPRRCACSSQPTRRQRRARPRRDRGRRSPRPPARRCVGTWARNIEPNLPAPIRPTRTGRPASARAASLCIRFTGKGSLFNCLPCLPPPSPETVSSRCAALQLRARRGSDMRSSARHQRPTRPAGLAHDRTFAVAARGGRAGSAKDRSAAPRPGRDWPRSRARRCPSHGDASSSKVRGYSLSDLGPLTNGLSRR